MPASYWAPQGEPVLLADLTVLHSGGWPSHLILLGSRALASTLRMLFRRSSFELGQRIRDGEPRRLGTHPNVTDRVKSRITVNSSETEAVHIRVRDESAVNWGAAARAKRAELAGGGFELANEISPR